MSGASPPAPRGGQWANAASSDRGEPLDRVHGRGHRLPGQLGAPRPAGTRTDTTPRPSPARCARVFDGPGGSLGDTAPIAPMRTTGGARLPVQIAAMAGRTI